MNPVIHNERKAWLGTLMGRHRRRIMRLFLRLRSMAVSAGNSVGFHGKFLALMAQVADEREKELDVLHEIEAMEKKHRDLKEMKKLRRADDTRPEIKEPRPVIEEEQPKPRGMGLLSWLALAYLFNKTFAKPKAPEPNAD